MAMSSWLTHLKYFTSICPVTPPPSPFVIQKLFVSFYLDLKKALLHLLLVVQRADTIGVLVRFWEEGKPRWKKFFRKRFFLSHYDILKLKVKNSVTIFKRRIRRLA